jgi:hypothetical protein
MKLKGDIIKEIKSGYKLVTQVILCDLFQTFLYFSELLPLSNEIHYHVEQVQYDRNYSDVCEKWKAVCFGKCQRN